MAHATEHAPPDAASLYEAALRHLARYAATEQGLRRVLDRRVARWARAAGASAEAIADAKRAVRGVVARLVAAGAIDDTAFASGRTRRLVRSGHSRAGVAAHLAARGIAAGTAREAFPDDADAELAAALVLARRRHIGPFRTTAVDADGRRRELGVLARAGFPHSVATRALAIDATEAEERVRRLRRS